MQGATLGKMLLPRFMPPYIGSSSPPALLQPAIRNRPENPVVDY